MHLNLPLPWLTTSVVLSFWFITATMPSITGLTITEGNTARRGTSPGKPAFPFFISFIFFIFVMCSQHSCLIHFCMFTLLFNFFMSKLFRNLFFHLRVIPNLQKHHVFRQKSRHDPSSSLPCRPPSLPPIPFQAVLLWVVLLWCCLPQPFLGGVFVLKKIETKLSEVNVRKVN